MWVGCGWSKHWLSRELQTTREHLEWLDHTQTARGNKKKTNNKMADLSSHISMITENVNGLNKRQRLAEQVLKMTQLYAVNMRLTSNSMTWVDGK